jgi:hypothetical protein
MPHCRLKDCRQVKQVVHTHIDAALSLGALVIVAVAPADDVRPTGPIVLPIHSDLF